MYCSSCGSAVPPGLSYCNRCGTDLRTKESNAPAKSGPSANILVAGIVVVTTVGLLAVIMLIGVMSQIRASEGLINGFAAIAFFLLVLVDALFAWLLLRSKKSSVESKDVLQMKDAIRAELNTARTSEFAESVSSVTDHTTRTLEPVSSKRAT
jgi:hypothetical protein